MRDIRNTQTISQAFGKFHPEQYHKYKYCSWVWSYLQRRLKVSWTFGNGPENRFSITQSAMLLINSDVEATIQVHSPRLRVCSKPACCKKWSKHSSRSAPEKANLTVWLSMSLPFTSTWNLGGYFLSFSFNSSCLGNFQNWMSSRRIWKIATKFHLKVDICKIKRLIMLQTLTCREPRRQKCQPPTFLSKMILRLSESSNLNCCSEYSYPGSCCSLNFCKKCTFTAIVAH